MLAGGKREVVVLLLLLLFPASFGLRAAGPWLIALGYRVSTISACHKEE